MRNLNTTKLKKKYTNINLKVEIFTLLIVVILFSLYAFIS